MDQQTEIDVLKKEVETLKKQFQDHMEDFANLRRVKHWQKPETPEEKEYRESGRGIRDMGRQMGEMGR